MSSVSHRKYGRVFLSAAGRSRLYKERFSIMYMLKKLLSFAFILVLVIIIIGCSSGGGGGGSKDDEVGGKTTPPSLGKKFIGVKVCNTCHSSVVKNWKKTKHAKAFALVKNAGSDICPRCHTTGFNKSVDNGGYDENRSKKLINVQCESCHQAGASIGHGGSKKSAKSSTLSYKKVTTYAEACGYCHTNTVEGSRSKGQFDQWENSAHKQVSIECASCHNPHEAKNSFQLKSFGKITLANGTEVEADIAAICMGCHTDRIKDADSSAEAGNTPGFTQAEMLSGTGGVEYGETLENSFHATDNFIVSGNKTNERCVTCHMSETPGDGEDGHNTVGGHSFAMRDKEDNINIAACEQCHSTLTTFDRTARGDYDGDGTIEGIQTEIEGLLDILKTAITDSGDVTFSSDSSGFIFSAGASLKEKEAAFNWLFVNNDKSKGIHNTGYAVQLLQKSYKDLTGTDIPGATIR